MASQSAAKTSGSLIKMPRPPSAQS